MIYAALAALVILAAVELATIAVLLTPFAQSTPVDWAIGTLGIAPYITAVIIWLLVFMGKIISEIVRAARWASRKTRRRHSHPQVDA